VQAQPQPSSASKKRGGDTNAPPGGLGRAIRYLGQQRRSAIIAYSALLVATLAQLAVPQLVQNMIDAVTRGTIANTILRKVPEPFQAEAASKAATTVEQLRLDQANGEALLIKAALIIVVFAIVRGIFSFVQAFMAEKTSQGLAFDLRNAIFTRVQRLSFSYYDQNQTGQLMIRATDDVEKVRLFIAQGLVLAAQALLLLVGALIILALTNWRLTLVVIPLLPLAMGVLVLYIELLGTALGCWSWDAAPFGLLQTTNPPVGAFVCYVIADIVVIQALTWWHWLKASRRPPLIARGTRADYAHKLALARMLHDEQPLATPAPAPSLRDTHADGYGAAYSLGTLGLTYAALGDSERAITCFERTRSLASQRNDAAVHALAAWHIGQERLRQGNPAAARPLLQVYVDYLAEIRHPEAASYAAELAALID